jgi:hypothetical protein
MTRFGGFMAGACVEVVTALPGVVALAREEVDFAAEEKGTAL